MEDLTLRAPAVVGRVRQLGCKQLSPDLADDCLHLAAQRRRKVNLDPASRSAVPHITMWYLHIEHLFEAERLRT